MAPPKTTGKGKPPITQKEKAESYGLTLARYQQERVPIVNEMSDMAKDLIGKYTKGKGLKPGENSKYFSKAWSEARRAMRDKYGDAKLKELKIKYLDPTPAEIAARKAAKQRKKKKLDTGKKGAAKKPKTKSK
jgi:hypothetical protein